MSVPINDVEVVEKDIEALYLGNLKTVEFDLNLPTKGKYGSTISWAPKDERFITPEGKVTRPSYGKGDRIIPLTATFTYGASSISKVYNVNVLEEENNIEVDWIYPIKLVRTAGEAFHLPQVVSIKTITGDILAHTVTWDEGNTVQFDELGSYCVRGHIKDTEYTFEAEVNIVEKVDINNQRDKQADSFPLGSVRLTGQSMLKTAQDRRLNFLLTVDDGQMLYNFREAAGLDTMGAPEMIGWDSPDSKLKGHTTGHYLSALALCYAATGDETILSKLNYMIEELNKVQLAFEADQNYAYGFISGYSEEQFDLLETYTPYPEIWAPYYTLHKIFAGLLDCYQWAGNDTALMMADKLGDWTYNRLSRLPQEQLKNMWGMYIAGEFGGMNESLAQLYIFTRNPAHLAAAKLFDNDRLFFPMEQKVDALGALHANQHIPQVIGAMKIYEASAQEKYYQISDFFWTSVTNAHIYSIGGTGDGEMFQQPHAIGTKIDDHTAETCASYNMLKLTKELYLYEPSVAKMDYYERTMLNHILATTDHEEIGGSTYFMAAAPGAEKGFDVENSCCHGTGLENHFKYTEAIFFYNQEDLLVNLFVPAHLKDKATGLDVEVQFDENQPELVKVLVQQLDRTLKIRHPYWSQGEPTIQINGITTALKEDQGYIVISESLKAGDMVSVKFAAELRLEETPDISEICSVAYGPYILAAIHEEREYLQLGSVAANLKSSFIKEEGKLNFKAGDWTFKPLAQVNHEKYHLYVKK
ncbi:beta-L-arabinofuranosidase domain-containing protein [Paenibacillus sp. FSL R10-2734]|uniref:beta-L-arabinofuranosidase domain-containing protein n=1 Tax=Paenibacillus sp. FSL R10-2734 TaxID=2954691 RepID=UPI0030D95D8D